MSRLRALPRELQEKVARYLAPTQSKFQNSHSHPYYDARLLVRRARWMHVLCDPPQVPEVGRKRKLGVEEDHRRWAVCEWIQRMLPRHEQYILYGLREDTRVDIHYMWDLGRGCLRVDRPWQRNTWPHYCWLWMDTTGILVKRLRLHDQEWRGPDMLYIDVPNDGQFQLAPMSLEKWKSTLVRDEWTEDPQPLPSDRPRKLPHVRPLPSTLFLPRQGNEQ